MRNSPGDQLTHGIWGTKAVQSGGKKSMLTLKVPPYPYLPRYFWEWGFSLILRKSNDKESPSNAMPVKAHCYDEIMIVIQKFRRNRII